MNKNPDLVAFGQNIVALRKSKELTQEELAESSELDASYISGIERGVRNPSYLSLVRLAKGFGLTVWEMCKGVNK